MRGSDSTRSFIVPVVPAWAGVGRVDRHEVAALSGFRFRGIGHGEFLRVDGRMAVEEVAKVISNWRGADLDEQEKAMLAFTEKFTLTPGQITEADIEALRAGGFWRGTNTLHWIWRRLSKLGGSHRRSARRRRRKIDFPEEILKAFGVTREQLRTSLYEDDR